MKRFVFLTGFAVLAVSAVLAQAWGNWGGASQSITVRGTLQLQNGEIAVASGNTVYFVPALGRFVGFIEELKEGAAVSIEGYAYGNLLEPAKLTVNGNSYDFLSNSNNYNAGYGYGCRGYGNGAGGMRGYGRGGMMGNGFGRRW